MYVVPQHLVTLLYRSHSCRYTACIVRRSSPPPPPVFLFKEERLAKPSLPSTRQPRVVSFREVRAVPGLSVVVRLIEVALWAAVSFVLLYLPIHRRQSLGTLALLRPRKRPGVMDLLRNRPAVSDKGRKMSLRVFRPRNVLIIACHPISKPPVPGHPRASGEGKKRRPEKTRKGRGVSGPHKVITAYRCDGNTGRFYGLSCR